MYNIKTEIYGKIFNGINTSRFCGNESVPLPHSMRYFPNERCNTPTYAQT